MDLGIQGKLAVVTGASRGIGRNVVKVLVSEGTRVIAIARNKDDLDSLAGEVKDGQHELVCIVADLMAAGVPTCVMEEIQHSHGDPDILVNNVGGTLDIKDPYCSLDDWSKVYRFNLEIALEMNGNVIPAMTRNGWGRIVNIASTASLENNGPVTYCTIKAALAAYTRCMARILAPDDVVMSAVLPGVVVTEGGHWERAQRERPEHVEKYIAERCPLGRFAVPSEVGPLVAFLCSQFATFCQGSLVPVDGGQSRHYFGQ
ncbi:MAG: SDR family oxidoreductase [Nitrospirales bacterium]|nr:SDR family oxidoreductase [Nitrospira sp.]MDR4502358.1 SDR family oxidoreductase [Nitrospirales bacterium]